MASDVLALLARLPAVAADFWSVIPAQVT